MRQTNARLVARFALDAEEFTAADAMTATGLTRATVLGVCADLATMGWIEAIPNEPAERPRAKGRPALRYRLSRRAGVVVGLDADEHRFSARIADLRGEVLGRAHTSPIGRDAGPDGRIAAARAAIASALDDAGHGEEDVLLTVVGIPAPADASGRSPDGDNSFWAVMNAHLAEALDGSVIVENDANLAAIAERAHSDDTPGASVAALLTGERLGAGIIVDEHLLRGPRGGAGEMRFLRLVFHDEHATDGLGALARHWAQRALASGDEESSLRGTPVEDIDAPDVLSASAAGDPLAARITAELGERLARVAFALGSLLDVEKVVVCGAIAPLLGPVLSAAREALVSSYEAPVPELVASRIGGDVVVTGAIERALARVHDDPLRFLPPLPRREDA